MKKILAILCLAAFTSSAIAAPLASVMNQGNVVVVKLDKDKDKDKKKKGEKSCCSKDEKSAKSCHEGEGSKTGSSSATGSGHNGATEKKGACCSKDASKSCGKGAKSAEPAK
ncbi:MAG TPA: hypothetical protein PL185_09615 [Flavobacteriales bacterium]|nr:hypothetical protein [Flavobacteriales bacterium]HPH82821.1 hypothetical protein [Flavobacteriales bacterium]